jgi:hypothetical protein
MVELLDLGPPVLCRPARPPLRGPAEIILLQVVDMVEVEVEAHPYALPWVCHGFFMEATA